MHAIRMKIMKQLIHLVEIGIEEMSEDVARNMGYVAAGSRRMWMRCDERW